MRLGNTDLKKSESDVCGFLHSNKAKGTDELTDMYDLCSAF